MFYCESHHITSVNLIACSQRWGGSQGAVGIRGEILAEWVTQSDACFKWIRVQGYQRGGWYSDGGF